MAQDSRRDQPVRLPNPSAQPFVAALKTARFYAVLFFWATMVCVLAYATTFVLTEWVCLYDLPAVRGAPKAAPAAEPSEANPAAEPGKGPAAPAATSWLGLLESTALAAQATEPAKGELFPNVPFQGAPKDSSKAGMTEAPKESAAAKVTGPSDSGTEGKVVAEPQAPAVEAPPELTPEQRRQRAEHFRHETAHTLKPLRTIGVLTSILLGVTLFVYLQIALLGRLAGIRQLTNAVFLLLLFFATVMPWDSIFEGFRVSAFYDFTNLLEAHTARIGHPAADVWDEVAYYGRYFALPLVSTLLLALSGLQFSSGYRESVVANE